MRLDQAERALYYIPADAATDPHDLRFVGAVLDTLVAMRGAAPHPVGSVALVGLTFAHAAPTFLRRYEVPSGALIECRLGTRPTTR